MNVIRAFIAISLPEEIRRNLERVLQEFRQRLPRAPVRWAPANNIHLTLKFLGDVVLQNLEILKKVLRAEAYKISGFEVRIGGSGAFPSANRPRVIWVGVEAPAELIALQQGIEVETGRLGYAREERPFSPHLTLGRVDRNATPLEARQIRDALVSYPVRDLGLAQIREVHLFRSDLRPGGSIYTQLFTAKFCHLEVNSGNT